MCCVALCTCWDRLAGRGGGGHGALLHVLGLAGSVGRVSTNFLAPPGPGAD